MSIAIDKVILVDKPAGMTSFGVVARIRRVLSEQAGDGRKAPTKVPPTATDITPPGRKRVRVGHTGTLDPFATGLMVILTGKQTKNAEKYSKLDKVYEVQIKLGQTSTTGDPEGELARVSDKHPTQDEVLQAVQHFVGEIEQTPPIYSAIKVGGERAYKLARKGKTVAMPRRRVTVYRANVLSYHYPIIELSVHVSSGTYIRALTTDIGELLGTGAYTLQLRRTRVGDFDIENAKTLLDLGVKSC
jgi:tRNA pseudouridine55 synthase